MSSVPRKTSTRRISREEETRAGRRVADAEIEKHKSGSRQAIKGGGDSGEIFLEQFVVQTRRAAE